MGPRAAGLSWSAPAGTPRWRLRLEREWGVTLDAGQLRHDAELARLLGPLEAGLHQIDFPEVTLEDRITYLEHAMRWQMRRALHAGRFDLAVHLQRMGTERLRALHTASVTSPHPHPARDSARGR
jgi:hypothetical protein